MTSDRHAIAPYPLRIQPDLRTRLEDAATKAGRSLHAEIVARLEQSFNSDSNVPAIAALAFRIASLEQTILSRNLDLEDICRLGSHVIDRFTSSRPPTEREISEWRWAFGYLVGTWDAEARQRAIDEKDAAVREAQLRLHGVTRTRVFEGASGELFSSLINTALNSLPPASKVYEQSEEERQFEAHMEKGLQEMLSSVEAAAAPKRKPTSRKTKPKTS